MEMIEKEFLGIVFLTQVEPAIKITLITASATSS
jgi:hypothetical protein